MEHLQRGAHVRCTCACPSLSAAQVLCNTDDWITDALRMKAIFKSVDRYGSRAVSANQNGWVQKLVGPKTPLDVQGFDYSTDKYDEWHLQACQLHPVSRQPFSVSSIIAAYRRRTFPAFHRRRAAP
jgi:hypothetical protein